MRQARNCIRNNNIRLWGPENQELPGDVRLKEGQKALIGIVRNVALNYCGFR